MSSYLFIMVFALFATSNAFSQEYSKVFENDSIYYNHTVEIIKENKVRVQIEMKNKSNTPFIIIKHDYTKMVIECGCNFDTNSFCEIIFELDKLPKKRLVFVDTCILDTNRSLDLNISYMEYMNRETKKIYRYSGNPTFGKYNGNTFGRSMYMDTLFPGEIFSNSFEIKFKCDLPIEGNEYISTYFLRDDQYLSTCLTDTFRYAIYTHCFNEVIWDKVDYNRIEIGETIYIPIHPEMIRKLIRDKQEIGQ